MVFRPLRRLVCLVLATVALLATQSTGAATRPVSIGANANFEQHLAQSAHLGWSRIDIVWSFVNPQPGVWQFSYTDGQVNGAIAAGQQILAILHRPPLWVGGGQNENIPPRSTTEWSEFVRRVAQRYAGRIAAYEIWNEPDLKSTSSLGIGWGRNIEEPPLYVDFLRAAALEIRAHAPGTLVVGPTFLSRNDASGADNRKRRILQQIQAAVYPEGRGYTFVDAVSVHNNAQSTEPSRTLGRTLNYQNLAYVWNHAPSLRTRPVWVTEYGWRSNAVGESGQREKICNVTRIYTGLLEAAHTDLDDWDVRRAFIYILKASNASASIFRSDSSAKPVVTQYLQRLAFPATQPPALSADHPACNGSSSSQSAVEGIELAASEAWAAFAGFGLEDPQAALPQGYALAFGERSTDGTSLALELGDGNQGAISIQISPASTDTQEQDFVTESGARWTIGQTVVSLAASRAGDPLGKDEIEAVSTAIDPAFAQRCLVETVRGGDEVARDLGLNPPVAPEGFVAGSSFGELTRLSAGCGRTNRPHLPMIDLTWSFGRTTGESIRAGIYRYEDSSEETVILPRSLHWTDGKGNRLWVAAEVDVMTSALTEALYSVAKSMDPSFQP